MRFRRDPFLCLKRGLATRMARPSGNAPSKLKQEKSKLSGCVGGKTRSADNAVLFYDTDADEGNDEFSDDIEHAVRFSLVAA